MTQPAINLTPSLVDLPDAERDALLRAYLFEVFHAGMRRLQQELAEAHA